MAEQEVRTIYERIVKGYLESSEERYLYQAAQLGRRLLREEVHPEAIVEMHVQAVESVTKGFPLAKRLEAMKRAFTPLLEAMMAYGLASREQLEKRKRAEERIEHLNFVLHAIRRVNQLIAREKDRDRLLQGACDRLIETRGYYNAWSALLDEAGGLVTIVEAGLGEKFTPLVERLKRGELTACGQRALSQSGVVVTQDPPSTCADCPLAMNYAGRGALTTRLEHGGKVYGLLSASIPAHLTADREEQVLFEEVARDIAFALHSIELEEERGRTEEALRESEEKYRSLIEQSGDAIYLLYDHRFEVINPKFEELFGVTPEEAKAPDFDFRSLVAPKSRPLIEERMRKLAEGQELSPRYEFTALDKDSNEIEVEVSVSYVPYRGGTATQGVLRDITARVRAEEALRESEVRYRELADSITDVFFAMDENLRYTYWNRASEELTGIPAKDAIGKSLYDLFPDTPQTRKAKRVYLDVLRTQQPQTFVNEYQSGGKDSFLEISAYPSERGLSVFVKDITRRQRAEEALRQNHMKLQRALEGTVQALGSAVELRDPYTAGHQQQVSQLACAIANEMGLPEEQIEGLRLAALIHDMGKMTVPAEILNNPGELNNFQWGLIKSHPQIGYDILKGLDFPWPLADIVLQHHERLDGSGYPQGLSDGEIMLEARILAVADVVVAMASHRPYRPSRGLDKALEEISQNRGRLYDPEAVDACLKLFTEDGFTFE